MPPATLTDAPATRTVAAGCAHCGLPLPGDAASSAPGAGTADRFCCAGCRTAYALLTEHGLAAWYALADREGQRVVPSGRGFEEFDHEAFRALYVRRDAAGAATVELYLDGVHCAACVWLVERVPIAIPGVQRAELDVRRSLARITWDDATVPLSAIARFLDRIGYRPHPFRGVRADALRTAEDRRALAGIGLAGAVAANVMLLALATYAGWFSGMEPAYLQLFRWFSLLVVTPAVFGPGRVFFQGAWGALRARTLHMDLPVALSLAAGYLRGAWNVLSGGGPIYLDGVATLVFLLLCGRYAQRRAQRQAADATELLHSLAPASARVVEDGAMREVPVEALLPGMLVHVRTGETLAADGIVVEGQSTLDTSFLTGESRPQAVTVGDDVCAGAVNLTEPIAVRVARAGEATRLGQLLARVEAGARQRAPLVQFADRLAGAFVAAVLVLAAAALLWWWPQGHERALDIAVAVLVVTCPCALALATPLAVNAAIGRAARGGILIRTGEALERLARPGLLVLDKTGTLTTGRTTLLHWTGAPEARALAAALERHAAHPVADALVSAWGPLAPAHAFPTSEIVATAGGGIEGVVAGCRVIVGSPAFVATRLGEALPARWQSAVQAVLADAATPVAIAVDGAVAGVAGLGDAPRPGTANALDALRRRGWRIRILSGDHAEVVRRVGASLGVPAAACTGGANPEEKLATITRLGVKAPVVMVGDGVNDAGAIAAASVGIGVHGGAEASLASADVHLVRPGLASLVQLVDLSHATLRLIRWMVAGSLLYNLLAATLTVMGKVDPLIAAIIMPLSSIAVILLAWRAPGVPQLAPGGEA